MKKNLYIPLITLFGATNLLAQTQNDTIWIGYSDQVSPKSEALYYKFIKPKKDKTFEVTQYTKKNVLYSKGVATNSESPSVYNGIVQIFDQQGKALNTFEFVNGIQEGKAISTLHDGTSFEALFQNNQLFNGTVLYEYEDVYTSLQSEEGEMKRAELFSILPNKHRQIVYFSDNAPVKEETYDGTGQLIASCTYSTYVIGDGTHLDFYYNPFRVKAISEHANGALIKKSSYFRSGELKEIETLNGNKSNFTSYDKAGKVIAIYEEQTNPEDYSSKANGTKISYNTTSEKEDQIESISIYKDSELLELREYNENGIIKNSTYYRESYIPEKIVNYDKKGNIESEITYDENGTPANGTEKADNYVRIYQDGKLISETQYYSNGTVFKKYSNFRIVYLDKKTKQIGAATFDPQSEYSIYSTPKEGVILVMDDKDIITDISTYKNGKVTSALTFVEYNGKTIKIQELIYDSNEYLVSDTKYHNNGKVLSQNKYVNYQLTQSSFYDNKGTLLGKYDHQLVDGTLYSYFESTNDIESISKFIKGNLQYKKTYAKTDYFATSSKIYLESEIDYNKEGLFYEEGELVSKATYKNGKPYQGKTIIRDEYASKTVSNYENGEKEGEEITYSLFGDEIVTRDFYHLGNQIFTETYEDNILSSRIAMEDGMYNGEAIYFNAEGEETSRLIYKDSEPYEGTLFSKYGDNYVQSSIYKNGQLVEYRSEIGGTLRYVKTLIDEEKQVYHIQNFSENGSIRYDFKVIEDYIDGEVLHYNEKGKIQNKAVVKDGKLISGTISLVMLDNNYESTNHMLITKKGQKYATKVYSNEDNSLLYESKINVISKKDGTYAIPINLQITITDLYPLVNDYEPDFY